MRDFPPIGLTTQIRKAIKDCGDIIEATVKATATNNAGAIATRLVIADVLVAIILANADADKLENTLTMHDKNVRLFTELMRLP